MKKRVAIILSIALGVGTDCVYAQSHGSVSAKESFQEFKRRLKQDYNDFRSRIFEHYSDFLAGEWHSYEPLIVKRDGIPKPIKQPKLIENPNSESPKKPSVDKLPFIIPDTDSRRNNIQESATTDTGTPLLPTYGHTDKFSFYGIPLELKHSDFNILNRVTSPAEVAKQWNELKKEDALEAAKTLDILAGDMGFNGYLTFRLTEAYLKSRFPSATASAIMSATHFMLVSMGYDARIAIASSGLPLMLLPMEQTVYGSLYLKLNGRTFTAFPPEGADMTLLNNITIHTCQLPEGNDKGRKFDLRLDGLKLPACDRSFILESGGITLKGKVNENLFPMLYRYPQMPTEDFAISTLDKELRKSLVEQIRTQLGGMEEQEAVNTLLRFFHGLPYATDEQQHGFEKPYFIEETLYYDKCDCEDRAIMFTWLLWHALGIPNHLVAYPGHESAAVKIHGIPTSNSGYKWGDATYWSADPTYIGASIGDIMPNYSASMPHIDYSYE